MSKSTDERGRISLPKDVRERFGDQYRIVELPSHVALFPVDEDPLEGLQAAVGDAFAEAEADELIRIIVTLFGSAVSVLRSRAPPQPNCSGVAVPNHNTPYEREGTRGDLPGGSGGGARPVGKRR